MVIHSHPYRHTGFRKDEVDLVKLQSLGLCLWTSERQKRKKMGFFVCLF